MFDLFRLRLLRELAHRGTMAAVANAFRMTSSAGSQQLPTLEREAGVALLERVGRRAVLRTRERFPDLRVVIHELEPAFTCDRSCD